MMLSRKEIKFILIFLVVGLFVWSCSEDEDKPPVGPGPTEELADDCIGCHTNEDMLRATALPDEEPPGDPSGEG
ncbi:hypothetical protein KKG05_04010 [bacterium]|nr:hypothetical protein [bacterium]